jgi:hypothetical protein
MLGREIKRSFQSALTRSSHNSSQNNINTSRSINLRIVNRIPESNNMNTSLSQSLFTNNSLLTDDNLFIDFSKLTLFNFDRAFGRTDAMVIEKLKAIRLLVPPDDPELYKCQICGNILRRAVEDCMLSYR